MDDVIIRLATHDDIPALIQVGDELFDNPIKPERTREFFSDDRHHLIVALDDDKIVAFASGFHYVHPDKDPQMFINEVSVLEEFQNQGIGRSIVRKLIAHAKEIGCREAWIGTEISNKAAIKAYLAAEAIKEDEEAVILVWENL